MAKKVYAKRRKFSSPEDAKTARAQYLKDWIASRPKEYRTEAKKRHLKKGGPELKAKYAEDQRERDLRLKYGMTVHEYDQMVIYQNGVCAICRQMESTGNRRLAVDHCHSIGKVRGLLCGQCNLAIGKMGDSPSRLRAAADYLEKADT